MASFDSDANNNSAPVESLLSHSRSQNLASTVPPRHENFELKSFNEAGGGFIDSLNPKQSVSDRNMDIGQGRGVFISTYGCQMNVNDTERMYSLLEMVNFAPVPTIEEASLIIVNSCSIREKPVHKVYSEVGTFKKLKEKNPNLKIGVGGCVGQQEKEKLIKNQPLIDFVFGTDSIDILPNLVQQVYEADGKKIISAKFDHRAPYHVDTLVRNPGVSTFVNITKGCDNFCSFCVVPFTRGREKSRPLKHILSDAKTLVARGVKELTLLGQNVNSYESECGADLADLLQTLARETDLQRIRFTTSHPKDFDQKLVDVMFANQPKVCEYIHLPFQSGNSRILELMNRGYTREQYLEKIAMIKKAIPNVVLSTDIIVGFPGETEANFLDTMSLVQEVGYETIFAFKYSQRPNTKAAQFTDQVPEPVKSERLNRLFEFHNKMAFELVKNYEGRTLDVLVEQIQPANFQATGRTSQNKLIHFILPSLSQTEGSNLASSSSPLAEGKNILETKNNFAHLVGQIVPVRVTKASPAVLRGELVIQ